MILWPYLRRRGWRAQPVTSFAPAASTAPVVAGTIRVGNSITVTPGTYVGNPTPVLTYDIMRAGVAIVGQTGLTKAQVEAYVETGPDVGPTFGVKEYATNAVGVVSQLSNTLAYDPVTDTSVIEAIDPSVIPGTTYTSFVGLKGRTISVNTGTGTKDATGLNGTPCLTFNGSTSIKLNVDLSAQSAIYMVAPIIQPQATLAWLWSIASGFDGVLNDSGPWEMLVNATNWRFVTALVLGSTSSACLITTKYDRAAAFGATVVRKNGVSLTLTDHGTGAVPSPATMPNGTLYIGNRVDLPAYWVNGKLGVLLICVGGMTANQLATVEAYANYRTGTIF